MVLATAFGQTHVPMRYGGTLVVGLSMGDPDALDPSVSRSFSSIVIYRTMCLKLYDPNSKLQIVPQLASALPVISKDKLSYSIPLRRGIRFNDDTPFDAQAVITTLQRNLTIIGSSRASDLGPIDSMSAPGPHTVVIHLKSPYTPLTAALASPAGAILSPTQLVKRGNTFGAAPVCVGPFMFDHRVAGDNVTVIKSPYYYDNRDVYLDKIVFKPAADAAAAAAALKAGDLQALDSVATTELAGVQHTSSLHTLKANGLGYEAVFVNMGNKNGVNNLPYGGVDTPLASSAKLRQAFEEAINRNTLSRVVFGDHVLPGCTPVSPASTWFDARFKCTPYNPADAKRLVAASGVSSPTVHLLTQNLTDQLLLAQFIQAQEAVVGINVVIDAADPATTVARATKGNYDAYLNSWSGGNDPDRNIFAFLATSGSRNYSGYSSPRLDLILSNGRKAITDQARKTLYHAAVQVILTDRPLIYLYHPIRYAGVSAKVTGVQLWPDTQLRVASAQIK